MEALTIHSERHVDVVMLGRLDYLAAWQTQKELAAARAADRIPDTLLLLEHPHTYTFGRSAGREHLLISEAECARRDVALYDVDRGGDVTYHGPGQVVGYPILRLSDHGLDYHAYLRALETVIMRALTTLNVTAGREPGYTGVWAQTADRPTDELAGVGTASSLAATSVVGVAKIAAIGVKVNAKGITSHGFALNVNTDLRFFDWIIPCGISEREVTSLAKVLGHPLPMETVTRALADAFTQVFFR